MQPGLELSVLSFQIPLVGTEKRSVAYSVTGVVLPENEPKGPWEKAVVYTHAAKMGCSCRHAFSWGIAAEFQMVHP
eukprot:1161061-Pelagomonas_calceolata.AAC.7